MARTVQAEQGAVAELAPWFHNLHLPDGRQTAPDHPLGDFPAFKWRELADTVPADLTGLEVVDIGCNAGFYSFELARRGARVTGLDVDDHYLRQARWAAPQLDPDGRVRFQRGSVYDLVRDGYGTDLVWFMGLLYHLRHPLLALDLIRRRCRRWLMFQTLTLPEEAACQVPADLEFHQRGRLAEPGWPRLAFIEQRLAGDPTNWWAASPGAVEALLRSSGFRVLARPGHELYWCEVAEPDPLAVGELEAVIRAGG